MFGLQQIARLMRAEMEEEVTRRAQVVPMGDGVVLARVLGRYKMYLRTDDVGFAAHVMLDGFWESWLTQFFARYIKPGMAVADVGANFGYYTCLFADAVGPTGRVVAFEPVATTAALLRRTLHLNGFDGYTALHEVALGDRDGSGRMLVPSGEPKNAMIVSNDVPDTIVVPMATLDRVCADLPRLDLVKIDAEGAEQAIFNGMQSVLRKRPAILLEFNAGRYVDAAGFLARLCAYAGSMKVVGFDGNLAPITASTVLERRPFDDWLLFFEP